MSGKSKIIIFGVLISAAFTLAMVSCMQIFSSNNSTYIDMDNVELVQENMPKNGDPTATIKTSLGDISIVLYPEYAPNAVKNFTELAQSGYYNDTYIFQSEPGIYFSAGSQEKNGDLGEKAEEARETQEIEVHQNLWPFKGAVYSMPTGKEKGIWKNFSGKAKTYNGSRFAVLNSVEFTDEFKEELLNAVTDTTISDAFIRKGGVPNLSQQVTIFGQTYEGFDVIDALTSVEVQEGENDVKIPKDDLKIKEIIISTYSDKINDN